MSRNTRDHLCVFQTEKITESQDGRGWKGPLWIIWSNSLPKQGHPEQVAQDLVQVGFEYLQSRRLHNLPGQPVPVLRHPQSKEVLPHVQMEKWSYQRRIIYRAEHQLRSDGQSVCPLRGRSQVTSIKMLTEVSLSLLNRTSHAAGSQRGRVRKQDATLSVFVPSYSPKTRGWNTHFNKLAQTSTVLQSPPRGSLNTQLLFRNKMSAEQPSDMQAWKKKGALSADGGKITKNPSAWLLDDIWYMVWAFLWIPDKSICYAELEYYIR